jgi:hypothetical protein
MEVATHHRQAEIGAEEQSPFIPEDWAMPGWHGPGPCRARAILTGPQPGPTSKWVVPCRATQRASGQAQARPAAC